MQAVSLNGIGQILNLRNQRDPISHRSNLSWIKCLIDQRFLKQRSQQFESHLKEAQGCLFAISEIRKPSSAGQKKKISPKIARKFSQKVASLGWKFTFSRKKW